jgi:hypothetical protein
VTTTRETLRGLLPAVAMAAALLGASPARAQEAFPFPPTEIAQDVTLQQAAQAGLVTLTAKGGFGGDVMAVDLRGARIAGAPVTVRVRVEFWGTDRAGNAYGPDAASRIERAVEARLAGLRASDGTPVTIDLIAKARRTSDAPTPGFHQVELKDVPRGSGQEGTSEVHTSQPRPGGVLTGTFGANEVATTYAHEIMHLMGFHDRYNGLRPTLLVEGRQYPLPAFSGDRNDRKALDAWWAKVLAAEAALERRLGKSGKLLPGIEPGHEKDILANHSADPDGVTVLPADVDALIARAGVHLRARPGDLLVGKDSTLQNLGVGAATELYAPRGGAAHADGIFAYCIDLHRHSPRAGVGYDVLPQAAALGGPQLAALQAVLEQAGRLQQPGALSGPSAAQTAVWAITDASSPSESAAAFLGQAGVAFDPGLFAATPHFTDPNAGAAGTAAITPTGVLPAIAADASTPPAGPPGGSATTRAPRLVAARVLSRVTARRARQRLRLALVGAFRDDVAEVTLTRLGRRRPVSLGAVAVSVAPRVVSVPLPRLRAGRYRIVLRGSRWSRRLALRVVARRR